MSRNRHRGWIGLAAGIALAGAGLAAGCKKKNKGLEISCGYTKLPKRYAAFRGAIGDGKVCLHHEDDDQLRVIYRGRQTAAVIPRWRQHLEKTMGLEPKVGWGQRNEYARAHYLWKGQGGKPGRIMSIQIVPYQLAQPGHYIREVRVYWEEKPPAR